MNATATRSVANGLLPYAGPWAFEQAAHLLRRATFGPTIPQIKWALDQGLSATLAKLFEEGPLPNPPVNPYYPDDPGVPIGETWVEAPYLNVDLNEQMEYRGKSLYSWNIGLIWNEDLSIREKLTLFWHNHFPLNAINDPKFMFRNNNTLRSHAWGNFRQLTKEITIDPSMLIYLNGNQNKAGNPNENYARELLELFTVGKGPQIGPGDYSNYTEQDVAEVARILSGWRDFGFTLDSPDGQIGSTFLPDKHDEGVKTLSYHFGNVSIPNMGDQEYAHLIDLIFEQDEVARFICRKLYRWFVFYQIPDDVEANVIEPMAQVLIDNDYEIRYALEALLGSQHFFDMQYSGLIIKNPIEFMMSIVKTLEVDTSTELDKLHDSWYRVFGFASGVQMAYYEVPEVAGWQAYYRAPLFYRNWLNASTLPLRMAHTDTFMTNGYYPFQGNGDLMRVDVIKLAASLDDPLNPDSVVDELARLLFPQPISPERHAVLKEILLPGLPDFEWTVEYGDYLADPANSDLASAVDAKLRALVKAMLSMPDFYLH
ncbi:MAG: DUF1800 domain-containing protein [Saprospirales bacterium]|nr:DUF1800 domain-containing protein [Saprospirales bacterium]